MPLPTTSIAFSLSTPAAPAGDQDVVFQSDGGTPQQKLSAYPQRATSTADGVYAFGTTRPDGVTLDILADGTMFVVDPNGGGSVSGTGATDALTCVAPAGAKDGSNTIYMLPTPVADGTDYFLVRNGAVARQLGSKAEYTVQGSQITLATPLLSDDWIEFYYTQGGSNTDASGSGSVTPVPTATLRGSSVASGTGSSATVPLPAGSQVGDLAILFAAAAYNNTLPSGWASLYQQNGGTWNGLVASKILDSGDISTGSVTVPFGGSYDYVGYVATFIGATGGVREVEGYGGNIGSPQTLTTSGAVVSSDLALYFLSERAGLSPVITPAAGTANSLQTTSTTNSTSLLQDQVMPGGAFTVTYLNMSATAGCTFAQVVVKV